MCIVFFLWTTKSDDDEDWLRSRYRLVVLSNRDEFLERPALGAHEWEGIFGPRDMEVRCS